MAVAARTVVVLSAALIACTSLTPHALDETAVLPDVRQEIAAGDTSVPFQGTAAEEFLQRGRITRVRSLSEGVTGPKRATVERSGQTQDAALKDLVFTRPGVTQLDDGSVIYNMEDSWRFEIAAYRIDRMIGLGLVPATVEREYRGTPGSLQWWIAPAISEAERRRDQLQAPDQEDWNRQQLKMALFDNLLFNWDRHLRNILITPDFQLRLIDHSRAFLAYNDLRRPQELTRFSRSLLAGLERLNRDDLRRQVGRYIEPSKTDALLARRDKILELAKTRVAELGEDAVLYP